MFLYLSFWVGIRSKTIIPVEERDRQIYPMEERDSQIDVVEEVPEEEGTAVISEADASDISVIQRWVDGVSNLFLVLHRVLPGQLQILSRRWQQRQVHQHGQVIRHIHIILLGLLIILLGQQLPHHVLKYVI